MWERLWNLIVLPDPTIWAGFFGFGGALLAGWLGGVIGGRRAVAAALLGAHRAHEDNLRLAEHTVNLQTIAFVQAIRTEFDALYIFVNLTISPAIAEMGPDEPLMLRFVLSEDYSTIYRANASLLGNVDDAEVRDKIVRAYLRAQEFIDTIRMNNVLVAEAAQTHMIPTTESMVPAVLKGIVAREALATFAKNVVNTHSTFIDAHGRLFEKTQAWLERKGVVEFKPHTQVIRAVGIPAP